MEDPILLTFCDDIIRIGANLFAKLFVAPRPVINAAVGRGIPERLGTTTQNLLRANPWTPEDYAQIPEVPVLGSDKDNRTLLTNHDIIKLLRGYIFLQNAMDANSEFGPLIYKIATQVDTRI